MHEDEPLGHGNALRVRLLGNIHHSDIPVAVYVREFHEILSNGLNSMLLSRSASYG